MYALRALRDHDVALEGCVPIHVVEEAARHRSVATTQHHIHVLEERLENAARRIDENRAGITAG